MNWTEIKIEINATDVDKASDIANMVVPWCVVFLSQIRDLKTIIFIVSISQSSAKINYLFVKTFHNESMGLRFASGAIEKIFLIW